MDFRERTKIKIAISKMTEKEKQMNKEKSFKQSNIRIGGKHE